MEKYESEYDKMLEEMLETSPTVSKKEVQDILSDRFKSEIAESSDDVVSIYNIIHGVDFKGIIENPDDGEPGDLEKYKDAVVCLDLGDGHEDLVIQVGGEKQTEDARYFSKGQQVVAQKKSKVDGFSDDDSNNNNNDDNNTQTIQQPNIVVVQAEDDVIMGDTI